MTRREVRVTVAADAGPLRRELERAQEALDAVARDLARQRAAADELAARRIARSYLPRRLRWLVAYPRLLRLTYRLRPSWRPRLSVGVDLGAVVVAEVAADNDLVRILHIWQDG